MGRGKHRYLKSQYTPAGARQLRGARQNAGRQELSRGGKLRRKTQLLRNNTVTFGKVEASAKDKRRLRASEFRVIYTHYICVYIEYIYYTCTLQKYRDKGQMK